MSTESPSILDGLDEEVTVLAFSTGTSHLHSGIHKPILAFKFREAATEAAEILNDFVRDAGWFKDPWRSAGSKDYQEFTEVLRDKLEELSFPSENVWVEDLGIEFYTYQLPLRD